MENAAVGKLLRILSGYVADAISAFWLVKTKSKHWRTVNWLVRIIVCLHSSYDVMHFSQLSPIDWAKETERVFAIFAICEVGSGFSVSTVMHVLFTLIFFRYYAPKNKFKGNVAHIFRHNENFQWPDLFLNTMFMK